MKSTSKTARISRLRGRRNRRGAALVEAAVVIPVMLVFLGLTMFVHNAYDEKLALQTSTRAQVLYYGSHNCEEVAPENVAKQLGTKSGGGAAGTSSEEADQGAGNEGRTESNKLDGNVKAGLSKTYNVASAHRDGNVAGTAVQDRQRVALSAPVQANSEAPCNEKRYDSAWTAVFKFIPGFLKSGGGISR
jgi:Flp pilus assembly protein TadG